MDVPFRWTRWMVVPFLVSLGSSGVVAQNVIHAGWGRWSDESFCRRKHLPRTRPHTAAVLRPTISRLSPDSFSYEIPHAASGMYPTTLPITIYGSHFKPGAIVCWSGKAEPTRFVSTTQLMVSIPFLDVRNVPLSGESVTFTARAWIAVANPKPHAAISKPVAFPITANAID